LRSGDPATTEPGDQNLVLARGVHKLSRAYRTDRFAGRSNECTPRVEFEPATLGFGMCSRVSDSLALGRVFSGVLASVNHRMLIPCRIGGLHRLRISQFAGNCRWAVKIRTFDLGIKRRPQQFRPVSADLAWSGFVGSTERPARLVSVGLVAPVLPHASSPPARCRATRGSNKVSECRTKSFARVAVPSVTRPSLLRILLSETLAVGTRRSTVGATNRTAAEGKH
jgi:hypothetical protein